MLDGNSHQFGKGAHAELGLELGAGVGDGLVAHVQMLGDHAIWFAFGDECQRLQLATAMRFSGVVVPLASINATSDARS